jgi:hypothetical protein
MPGVPRGTLLSEAVESSMRRLQKTSLDLSFNELMDMHKQEPPELDIDPAYQRLFRWSTATQSRFVETLLLEMPVPPIYVVEEEESRYTLIDGLQRVSTYLHLRGELEASYRDPPIKLGDKLKLDGCDIVPNLNGLTFDDLDTSLQIKLKRAFIRVEVIRRGSDPRFRYHMFKRLNTGGIPLTDQQVRNCTIRLLSPVFIDFIKRLSTEKDFRVCISNITQEQQLGAQDEELVLRFFALKNHRAAFRHEIGDFLTDYMEKVSDTVAPLGFDYPGEEANFRKTFAVLATTLGEDSFAYADKRTRQLRNSFGIYHYEAITQGLQSCLDSLDIGDASRLRQLKQVLSQMKLESAFITMTTGGGKNSPGQLKKRIAYVESYLGPRL